jgi:acyl-CoA dehydrogenase
VIVSAFPTKPSTCKLRIAVSESVIKVRAAAFGDKVIAPSIADDLISRDDFMVRAERVAAIAAAHANAVDSDNRFPREAIDALRAQRLLGILVPADLGGEGASVLAVANICYALGRACASTAMIFAMHQVKVACIVRHGRGSAWLEELMRKLAGGQILFASSTTEGNAGGDVRSSTAPVEQADHHITLDRSATVISYGREADGIVTTARRDADAAKSDQVLLVLLKQDYALEPITTWNTLGMRGTMSVGFRLQARANREQILPVPYQSIHAETMAPTAHLFWSSVWAGIAAGAVDKAHKFVRHVARQANGNLPPGAVHLTKALSSLSVLRAMITGAAQRFEANAGDPDALGALDFQNAMLMLKIDASELAVAIVMGAMRVGGLSAYRQDGEFSIGRHLRDILSAPIMIHNDRILANAVSSSLLVSVPDRLAD